MFRISKISIAATTLVLGLPVLVMFQNCGQPGSASTTSSATNASIVSESLLIIPTSSNNADIQLDDPVLSEDNDFDHAKGSVGQCDQLVISDILLNIASIGANPTKPDQIGFEIVDSDKSISMDKLNLKIRALKSENIREIILLLSADGNKLLNSENVAMDLKTPSAQQSGIKVKLADEFSVVAGKTYNLELTVNPNEQIVTNKSKCLFKPVVRDALLSAL